MTDRCKMIRTRACALLLALTLAFGSVPAALADEAAAEHILLTIGASEMLVDEDSVSIEDAVPTLSGGRVYVPLRAVAEAFGATVEFDSASGDITIATDDTTIVMNTMASLYSVNGSLQWMDMAPYVNSDGRTMVPVRFVSDALGYALSAETDANGAITSVSISRSAD